MKSCLVTETTARLPSGWTAGGETEFSRARCSGFTHVSLALEEAPGDEARRRVALGCAALR